MRLNINEVHQGDARALLAEIEPDSIACSVWSPPYHLGKNYEKHYSYDDWTNLLREVICLQYPIIKPGGFLVINVADILCFSDTSMPRIQALNLKRQTSPVTREDILAAKVVHPTYNRNQLATLLGCSEQTIDRRLNGNNIRGGKYAPQTRVHLISPLIEEASKTAGFHLYDRRIWVKDAAWENSKWHTLSYRAVDEFEYLFFFWKPGVTIVDRHRIGRQDWIEWGSRAVWNIPSVRSNNDHEAKFPIELPRRVIKLLSDPGETILDCFMGSGTTAIAAIRESRNFIGIELLPEYADMAQKAALEEMRKAEFVRYDPSPIIHLPETHQLSLLSEA